MNAETAMLKFEVIPVGPLGCNCVILWDSATMKGLVVDPGDEAQRIRMEVEGLGVKVECILHTHGHFDHLGATKELQELWGCPAHLHPADNHLVECLDMQTGMFGMRRVQAPQMLPLSEGEAFLGFRVIHTPGHSPGCCCFYGDFESGPLLFSGDTLFAGGMGRTDVLGGNLNALRASVRKLYELPDETLVIPGHGPETTIGEEARNNPFVRR